MDGSPQLLTNIQFAEAKKGYDRDQVDNFLRELSGKVGELQDMLRLSTQRAEAAEVALAEAEKGRAAAEAAAAKARSEAAAAPAAPAAPATNEIEAATGVLAMAQKTAEATAAEADAKARDIIADARDRAATIVVEVEREADRLKADATAKTDQLVADRVTVIERDVERLSTQRDGLQLDVDLLRHYLDEHREKIRAGLDDINKILDQPGGLTMDRAPELGGTSNDTRIDSVARTSVPEPEPDATPTGSVTDAGAGADPSPAATTGAPSATGAPSPTGDPSPSGDPSPTSVVVDDTPASASITDPGPSASPSAATAVAGTATALAPAASEPAAAEEAPPELTIVTVEDLAGPAVDPEADFPVVKAPELFAADGATDAPAPAPASTEQPSIDLTSGSLFSQRTEEPTQAYDVLAGSADEPAPASAQSASSLGHVEDEADEAMRAFFEQDLDAAAKDEKPRGFLRRK